MPASGIVSLKEKVAHTGAAPPPQIQCGPGEFTPASSSLSAGALHHFQRLVMS